MLRHTLDQIVNDAVSQTSYTGDIGSFLFGFSSSTIFFIGLLIIMYIGYESIIYNKNNEVLNNILEAIKERKFVLPLYYSKNFRLQEKYKRQEPVPLQPQQSESINVRPIDKPEFIIPSLQVDNNIGFPLSQSPTPNIKTPLQSYSSTCKDDFAFSRSSSVLSIDYVAEIKRRNVSSNAFIQSQPNSNSP
jgi:hypothetical protein